MVAWILSFIWLWHDGFPGSVVVFGAGLVALVVVVQRRRKESFRDVFLAPGSSWLAIRRLSVVVLPSLVIIVVLGASATSVNLPPAHEWSVKLVQMVGSGLVQQYVLLACLYRWAREAIRSTPGAMLIAAGLFAVCHVPNAFLVAVTFAGGLAACWAYTAARNIIVIGIAHGIVSFALYYGLPRDITEGMRVGPEL